MIGFALTLVALAVLFSVLPLAAGRFVRWLKDRHTNRKPQGP